LRGSTSTRRYRVTVLTSSNNAPDFDAKLSNTNHDKAAKANLTDAEFRLRLKFHENVAGYYLSRADIWLHNS